jgi:hypothetical protein
MTYDHWKTTEPDDGAERHPEQKDPEPNQLRRTQVTLAEAKERLRDALEAMRITKRDAAIRENELIVALAAQDKIIAAVKAERDAIRAKTIEQCKNVALDQRYSGAGGSWDRACLTIADLIRNLPLTLACSAAMQLGFLIGSVVTG